MSTNFTGVTFPKQKVTPIDDALIRRRILPDGILQGCELSYSGSTLTMAAGQLMACGRQFRHPVAQNWPVVDATTGFARLLLTVDLTRTSSAGTFDQIVDTIEYASAEDGFPELIQEDINYDGSKYQIAICTLSLGAGGITGVTSQIGVSKPPDTGLSMTLLWENASPTSNFASQTISMDLSEYDAIMLLTRRSTSVHDIGFGISVLGHRGFAQNLALYTEVSAGVFICGREFTPSASGIVIGGGVYKFSNLAMSACNFDDAYAIPYRIYGIKGVTE